MSQKDKIQYGIIVFVDSCSELQHDRVVDGQKRTMVCKEQTCTIQDSTPGTLQLLQPYT